MIRDANIKYRGSQLAFGPYDCEHVLDAATPAIYALNGATTNQVIEQVASKGHVGMLSPAVDGTDLMTFIIRNPRNIDWENSQYCQVAWGCSGTDAAATATFNVSFYALADGQNVVDDLGTASEADSVTDTATGVAGDMQLTGWGIHGGLSFADGSSTPADNEKVVVQVTVSGTTGTPGNVYIEGLTIQYLPKLTDGGQEAAGREIPS